MTVTEWLKANENNPALLADVIEQVWETVESIHKLKHYIAGGVVECIFPPCTVICPVVSEFMEV